MSAYSDRILSLGPRAYWRLGASPLVDLSGNNNTLAIGGTTPASAAGLLPSDSGDTSRDFPAGGYYVAPGTASLWLSYPLTIEAWIVPDSVTGWPSIVRRDFTQYTFRLANGNLDFIYYDGAARTVSTTGAPIKVGVRYHLVVVDDGSLVKFYINGVLYQSFSRPTGSAATTDDGSRSVAVGANYNYGAPDSYFDGRIDEVAIYGTALSALTIKANYIAGMATGAYSNAVLTDGATFYWRLGESAGTVAVDTASALNGTYNSGAVLGQPGALGGSGDTDMSANLTAAGVTNPFDARHYGARIWTVEAWVYPTAATAASKDGGIVLSFFAGNPIPFALCYGSVEGAYPSNKRLWTGFYGAPWNKCVDPTDLPLNVWSHVAGTYDGTTLRLYRNGVQVASLPASGQQANTPSYLMIGTDWTNAYFFPGRIDEAAFYQTVLTPTQILDHYTKGSAPAAPPQTVQVPGVYPPGYTLTIAGQFLSGQRLAGGTTVTPQFGTPNVTVSGAVAQTRTVTGLGSAQVFGVPTVTRGAVAQTVIVSGVQFPGVTVISTTGQVTSGDGHRVGYYVSGQFGDPRFIANKPVVAGVPSAQAFGVPKLNIRFTIAGLGSAQQFGIADAFIVWLHLDTATCTDLDLVPDPETELVLVGAGVTDLDLEPAGCS